mmetsp:Transcript_23284/g.37102  ORF Transcript_23284/g.37102 Transcript_23284/m.37102 type:complete len:287 (-) Transcript_23284:1864-2724(-)
MAQIYEPKNSDNDSAEIPNEMGKDSVAPQEWLINLNKEPIQATHLRQLVYFLERFGCKNGEQFYLSQGTEGGTTWMIKHGEHELRYTIYASGPIDSLEDYLESWIEWGRSSLFAGIPKCIAPTLKGLLTRHGKISYDSACFACFLDEENLQAISLDTEGVIQLDPEHAKTIDDHWKFKSTSSRAMIETQLERGLGFGVLIDGKLVSWVLACRYGALGMLFTDPKYRGRGFASKVVFALCKRLRFTFGLTPYTYIETHNAPSLKMFSKLGFQPGFEACFLHFSPNEV